MTIRPNDPAYLPPPRVARDRFAVAFPLPSHFEEARRRDNKGWIRTAYGVSSDERSLFSIVFEMIILACSLRLKFNRVT